MQFLSHSPSDTTASARQRVGEKRQHRRLRIWATRTALGCLLLLALGVGSLLTFERTFAARVLPAVAVSGVPLGYLSEAEARSALEAHYAAFVQHPLTLTYGDRTWTPSLADLGAQLDIESAVQQALATGHHEQRSEDLRASGAIWRHGVDLPLTLTIDQMQLQDYLVRQVTTLEQPAVDAHLAIQGAQPVRTAARPGMQVLIDPTLREMSAALQSLAPQTVAVRTRPLAPLLSDEAAAAAATQVRALLRAPLALNANEQTWVWSPHELAPFVQITRHPTPEGVGDMLTVSLNHERIGAQLAPLVEATYDRGTLPRLDWNGGAPVIFAQGTPGQQIDTTQAIAQIDAALWANERNLTLPFVAVPVPSTPADVAALGLTDLLSVGRTSFEDSEDYRVTNIVAGMRLLHGILLAPGDEFSFNEAIGTIGAENGFVEGYAIVDEETQLEWGGGICQDSTTMYRAAFWAGLPIAESHNHSRYISWYDEFGYGEYGHGPGLDSTIFLGGPDLRFINDMDSWVLIQAYANPESEIAEIRLFGIDDGRTVEFYGPRISHHEKGAMKVAYTRIVRQDGVEKYNTTFNSWYEPWD